MRPWEVDDLPLSLADRLPELAEMKNQVDEERQKTRE